MCKLTRDPDLEKSMKIFIYLSLFTIKVARSIIRVQKTKQLNKTCVKLQLKYLVM